MYICILSADYKSISCGNYAFQPIFRNLFYIMIGRTEELKSLESAFTSNKPELVALLCRRRVGKTYLVRNYFGEKIDFEMVGIKDGKKEHQLRNFAYSLRDAKKSTELGAVPNDWLEAFYMLNHGVLMPLKIFACSISKK